MAKAKTDSESETEIPVSTDSVDTASPGEGEGGGVANSPGLADIGEISESLADGQPEVNTDVDLSAEIGGSSQNGAETVDKPAESEKSEFSPFGATGVTDSKGNKFNPEIHASKDNDGKTPIIRVNGEFAKKRGGASAKQRSKIAGTSPEKSTVQSNTGILDDEAKKQRAFACGQVTADTIINIGLFVSEDFKPKTENGVNERDALVQTWAAYYYATNTKELPPWMGLAIGNAAYIMPRLNQPKTRSRLGEFKGNIAKWWTERKARRAAEKAEKAKAAEKTEKDESAE